MSDNVCHTVFAEGAHYSTCQRKPGHSGVHVSSLRDFIGKDLNLWLKFAVPQYSNEDMLTIARSYHVTAFDLIVSARPSITRTRALRLLLKSRTAALRTGGYL